MSQKSRAEMFEDEKRRIIDSCFNKREPDGSRTSGFPLALHRRLFLHCPLLSVVFGVTDMLFAPASARDVHNSHPHHRILDPFIHPAPSPSEKTGSPETTNHHRRRPKIGKSMHAQVQGEH